MLPLIKSSPTRVDLTNLDDFGVCDVIRMVSLDRKTASYWKDSMGSGVTIAVRLAVLSAVFDYEGSRTRRISGVTIAQSVVCRRGRLMKRSETDRSNEQSNDRTFNESASAKR